MQNVLSTVSSQHCKAFGEDTIGSKGRNLQTGVLEGSLMYQGEWWVRMRRSHMYSRGLVCRVKAATLWMSMMYTLKLFQQLLCRMECTLAAE